MATPVKPPYKVVHLTAPLFLPNQGDADYASTLSYALTDRGVNSSYPLFIRPNVQQVLAYARKEKTSGQPVIAHVHLRPPNGGTLLNPKHLKAFDKLVVTVHEFIHLRSEQPQALEYIKAADEVIFSTPFEQAEVEKYIPDIREKSRVIPIFPSIEVMPPEEAFSNAPRPANIVHFSSIRAGKGHPDFLRLAALIKDDPELQDYQKKNGPITLHMVGNPTNPRLCMRLIGKIYAIPDEELPHIKKHGPNGEARIQQFLDELKASGRKPVLPVEITLNAKPEELQDICRDCNFAYLPLMRGATHHSTAIPVLMSNGCVTITTMGGHTPEGLKEGAVVFADRPADALKAIKSHLQVPQQNKRVRKAASEYVENISAEAAAAEHERIYEGLVKERSAHPRIPRHSKPALFR